MLNFPAEITCPYCGEMITIFVDLSVENQNYIEDCQVCCQPMSVSYTVVDGELEHLHVDTSG